jgi:glutaredoxin
MFCTKTEEFFRENDVKFTARNVAEDEAVFAELERMGTMTTPVIVIGGKEVVVGFDQKRLERLLEL